MHRRATPILLSLLVALAATAGGQIQEQRIDRLVSPYLDNHVVTGLAVGVIQNGQKWSRGYGKIGPEDARAPDGTTVYEIGSISKVFTGILLADAAVRQEVTLDDEIQQHLPAEVQLQVKDDPILLRHLATHTSGLPRLPDNMHPAKPMNPYAGYNEEDLYDFLSKHQPHAPAGQSSGYSNLAAGLLGHLLSRRAGTSYDELVTKRIAEPLHMTSTGVALSPSMAERFAPPHFADGSPAANWDFDALAGCGGIRSSVDDMLLFLAAQLDPPDGPLGEAIDLAWKIHHRPKEQGQFTMGLGWHVARDQQTRWHNGETGGYHAMMLANRDLNVGVIVLCNTATAEVDRLGEDIIRMLAGVDVEPRSFEKEVVVAPDVLKRYEGRYAIVPQFVLTVTAKGDQLHVQATGQPSVRVFPKSETEWFYKVVDARLTFDVDDDGKCNSLTLHQNGREMPAKRLED